MFFKQEELAGLDTVWRNEVSRTDTNGNPNKGRGKHAQGPVAVVIAVLAELGWH